MKTAEVTEGPVRGLYRVNGDICEGFLHRELVDDDCAVCQRPMRDRPVSFIRIEVQETEREAKARSIVATICIDCFRKVLWLGELVRDDALARQEGEA